MPYFIRNGNSFSQTDSKAIDIYELLPTATYTVKVSPHGQFYYETIDNFTLPPKLYGDSSKTAARIINTFMDRGGSTGVLLSGEKGSGKTLLVKVIAAELAKMDIPTIVINTPFSGEEFNIFIQQLEQPAAIIFDEFEKTYSSEAQEQILTLLDGIYASKKLFLLTANDKWKIDQHMMNRPGRIFYSLHFTGLETSFIKEYLDENLTNKDHVASVMNVSSLFHAFNFDMLKALVEEMNRYDESAQDALTLLNTKPDSNKAASRFDIQLFYKEVAVDNKFLEEDTWDGSPLSSLVYMYVNKASGLPSNDEEEDAETSAMKLFREFTAELTPAKSGSSKSAKKKAKQVVKEAIDDNPFIYLTFHPEMLHSIDGETGTFTYVDNDYKLILTKKAIERFNYNKLL